MFKRLKEKHEQNEAIILMAHNWNVKRQANLLLKFHVF